MNKLNKNKSYNNKKVKLLNKSNRSKIYNKLNKNIMNNKYYIYN